MFEKPGTDGTFSFHKMLLLRIEYDLALFEIDFRLERPATLSRRQFSLRGLFQRFDEVDGSKRPARVSALPKICQLSFGLSEFQEGSPRDGCPVLTPWSHLQTCIRFCRTAVDCGTRPLPLLG